MSIEELKREIIAALLRVLRTEEATTQAVFAAFICFFVARLSEIVPGIYLQQTTNGKVVSPMLHMLLEMLSTKFLFFALHLSNTSSFPPPLNAEEEMKCLLACAAGDKPARDKLVEHNLRLVVHVIKKYYSNCMEQDDLISVGTIGLIKAIDTFNVGKGARLATYAARCIDNEILMYFRNQKKTAQDVSMSDPIDIDNEGNPLTLMDVISMDDTVSDEIDLKIRVEQLYSFLGNMKESREKEILVLRYGLYGNDYHTQRQVAKRLGISRSYVSRIEKKAVTSLQKVIKS